MSLNTLFIAPPGTRNRKDSVFAEILHLCPGNDYSSVVYLGPDAPFLANVKKLFHNYLSNSGDRKAYVPFQAVTIKQLCYDLYETCGTDEIITDELRTILLLQLLEEKNLGYARLLSGLLHKIRHHVPDRDLQEVREETDRLIFEDKARDRALSALNTLQAYEALLDEKKYIDSERMLKAAIPFIEQTLAYAVIVIDGFHDPTPLEKAVLKAVISRSENVLILAEDKGPFADMIKKGDHVSLITLRPSLKRTGSGYVSYSSIEDEVEGIAKNMKNLMLQGTMPWEIALSFPDVSKYLPLVKRVLSRYDIPVSIGEYPLANTKPVVAIDEIISCIEDDYPRTGFLSVLTSPLFPAISSDIKEQAVSISYRAGIIQGKESWLAIKNTLHTGTFPPADKDSEQIEEFQKGIHKVVALIDTIKNSKNLSSYVTTFLSVLDKLGYFEALKRDVSEHTSGTARKISRQFSALRHFALTNKQFLHNVNPGMLVRFVLENLSTSDINSDGVRLLSYEQASGLEIKELFIGGMVEGEFPSKPAIDPIMPEKVKQALGMPHLEYYLRRQGHYFIRLLNISEKPPYVSCPSAEGDKIFLPSPLLNWDQEIRPNELDLYTEEEVLVREGQIRGAETASSVLWDSDLHLNKTSLNMVREKLRGYLNVTDIDSYRKCPMRFYIEKVLRLEAEKPPQFEVEARLWGSMAHKVMEQLFKQGDIEIHEIDTRLFQCLDAVLQQFPIDQFWGKVAKEIFQKLLPKIKEQEQALRMQGFVPVMVEKKLTADINGLKLKGKIDRIDQKISQTSEVRSQKKLTQNSVVLLDYKTGTIDSDSLQMPLYALMWNENSPDPVDKVGYYSLKEGKVTWYPKKVSMEEYVNESLAIAEELVSNMRRGYFPSEPFSVSQCTYCSHSPLCER